MVSNHTVRLCVKTDILTTLAFFDTFHYPLTQTELFLFLRHYYEQETYVHALHDLLQGEQVFKLEAFYSIENNVQLVARRRKSDLEASLLLDKAERIARFFSAFPFVRGIAISGSQSLHFANEKPVVDFFIITAHNKLWLARTSMHLFKKFTCFIKKDLQYCMNYYVDEAGLEIREKNIYTATELATLLPLRGIRIFQLFYQNNTWSRTLLPNHTMKIAYTKEVSSTLLKKIIEGCLSNPLGLALDYLLMKITIKRWAQNTKRQLLNRDRNIRIMDAGRHYVKPCPQTFQQKFLANYEQAVRGILQHYGKQLKPASR